MDIPLKIVDVDISREVESVKDVDGKVVELKPVPGSERNFLILELPDGKRFKAQVSEEEFNEKVLPVIDELTRPPGYDPNGPRFSGGCEALADALAVDLTKS